MITVSDILPTVQKMMCTY